MGVEPSAFLQQVGRRMRITGAGVRLTWVSIHAFFIAAAYLRFDTDQALLARALVVVVPVLAALYAMSRGLLASERAVASWPGGEAGFESDTAAYNAFRLEQKRAEWHRLHAGGRLRFVLRKTPKITIAVTPFVIGLSVLLVPAAVIPARVLPSAPGSILFLGAALLCAVLLAMVLMLWDWARGERFWNSPQRL